jgi:sulfite reductase (NADPH) flavoprotein alpha-component
LNIRVLFGTETGNAEDCAHQLGSALKKAGFNATVTDMDAFSPPDLASETLALIVTSTYGNGDPPYNAEALMNWLRVPDSSIAGVSFAVCALGDQTYPKFVQAGIDFDQLMEERGGLRVVPRQDCDVDYEEPFEQFTKDVVAWLESNSDSLGTDAAPATPETAMPASSEPAPAARLGSRSAPVVATLSNRRRLNRGDSAKETMHYEFQWPGNDVAFAPGDSFAVIPTNNATEVQAILGALALNASAPVTVGEESMDLGSALSHQRDLQTVTLDLLGALGASPSGGQTADAYLEDRHLLDVLRDHAACTIEAQDLVDGLRKLKPRLYSVASSPLVEPQGVHFTVETLRYQMHGRAREGVATTWLADRFADGDRVAMYCVQAPHFRLPQSSDVPVIMIGPGTGVAPFRAFLQHRKAQGGAGKSWLFFGHQHRETDFLYEDEFHAFMNDGTLSELTLAWSRDQPEKVYVQDRLRENGAAVWNWIEGGAHIYVCGDKNAMAPQVRETFVNIAVTEGGLSTDAASAMFDDWERDGRYCVDAY